MPVDLYRLSEGWLELESDPGLFTLLLEDFGCKGVQVEEIYDLQKPIEGTVFGFIFLFKWIEERRSRARTRSDQNGSSSGQFGEFIESEEDINEMFFAQQVIPNSCATHALLSVLLNCHHLELGSVLRSFKDETSKMSPENKGYAIGNCPELARAHNSHATSYHDDITLDGKFMTSSSTSTSRNANNLTSTSQRSAYYDAFHFVSYVPINGRLIELDGLKKCPIDHGACDEEEYNWTEKFRRVIKQRLERETHSSEGQTHDIRYNLMAVVPDRRITYLNKLRTLKLNRHIILEALQQMTRPARLPEPLDCHNYSKYPDLEVAPNKQAFMQKEEQQRQIREKEEEDQNEKNRNKQEEKTIVNESKEIVEENERTDMHVEGSLIHKQSQDKEEKQICNSISPQDKPSQNNGQKADSATISQVIGASLPSLPSSSSPIEELTIEVNCELDKTCNSKSRTDLQTPLTIETSISPTPSFSSSSTDTSSEMGSAFNSPNYTCSDGEETVKKMIVCRMFGDSGNAQKRDNRMSESSILPSSSPSSNINSTCTLTSTSSLTSAITSTSTSPSSLSSILTARDLIILLKKLEVDINSLETNLNDELEKRRRYKIDDSRRTHNYDDFITTFLAMLAERGKLASLVEKDLGINNSVANSNNCDASSIQPESPTQLLKELMQSVMSHQNKNIERDVKKKKKKKLRKSIKRIRKK